MSDWAEKYRPRSLSNVMGNDRAVAALRQWGEHWGKGKKAVILAGDPGVGKTTSAIALANDRGWGVVELNASDQRNYDVVRRIATAGALHYTFTDSGEYLPEKGKKLIILDEADNLSGKEDRGGLRAIVETIRETQQPIVLVVNDYYGLTRRSSALKGLCTTIRYLRIGERDIIGVLGRICDAEGVMADKALKIIAKRCDGDLRAAIRDLQALADGRSEIKEEDAQQLGVRDQPSTVFKALSAIFEGVDCNEARRAVWDIDESPEDFILWMDENTPRAYKLPSDLVAGYEALSASDVFLGRVKRRQNYRLWAYASDLMSAGVAMAKTRRPSLGEYRFPSWLWKMSGSRGQRAIRRSITQKIGQRCHISASQAHSTMLPFFKRLARDEAFTLLATQELGLDEREIAFLMGEPVGSKRVKRVWEGATRNYRE